MIKMHFGHIGNIDVNDLVAASSYEWTNSKNLCQLCLEKIKNANSILQYHEMMLGLNQKKAIYSLNKLQTCNLLERSHKLQAVDYLDNHDNHDNYSFEIATYLAIWNNKNSKYQ